MRSPVLRGFHRFLANYQQSYPQKIWVTFLLFKNQPLRPSTQRDMSKIGSYVHVVVHTPTHSALSPTLLYRSEHELSLGSLVRVPLGKRILLGIVWAHGPVADSDLPDDLTPEKIQAIDSVLSGIAPLPASWRALIEFTARYYQRSIGEVAIQALPSLFKSTTPVQLERRLRQCGKRAALQVASHPSSVAAPSKTQLTAEQTHVLQQIAAHDGPFLLHGTTGSGKTEVYLQAAMAALEHDPNAQILMLVPEINLTPQLLRRVSERFAAQLGPMAVVAMHSGMTDAQRFQSWLSAHTGTARLILGTRTAVLSSLPRLRLVIVDEEHDPSYKAQDGARLSARDLAIYRGNQEGFANCKVVLGSATPSLESWHASRPAALGGRYVRLTMSQRIGQGILPKHIMVAMQDQPKGTLLAPALLAAIKERIARGEQSLIFLNRRGYAPVLQCLDCGWKSQCQHCSAYKVFHKLDRSLRCHHCGFGEHVPKACPECGNLDILTQGRGTEQLEEALEQQLAGVVGPTGQAVRIARLDADSTKAKGSLEALLAKVHEGQIDVVVGTQMIAKGHDFRRMTLVAAINPDTALFSSDFRAPERLFGLLMQASGRAGRDADLSARSEMWIQSHNPHHSLFKALAQHDYAQFAEQQLRERQQAQLAPFGYSALLRAEARSQSVAQGFLRMAAAAAKEEATLSVWLTDVTLYAAVPMTIAKIANVERAQMLVESPSRRHLQGFLAQWQAALRHAAKQSKGLMRWAIDVDPQNI